jgi:drug/metabolite transporter (DMT)-like permease
VVLAISGNTGQLTTVYWQALAALAGAGALVFILGRYLFYYSLKLIGANRSGPLLSSSTLVGVLFGVTLMDEPFTWGLAVGFSSIIIGVVLVSTESGGNGVSDIATTKGDMIKGVATGLLAGICYGSGPVLAKIAIDEGNSPFTAIFISYSTALLLIVIPRLLFHNVGELTTFYKKAIVSISLGSISISVAQLCMYLAVYYVPVSVASPLSSTNNLFIIILSFIINRKIELFTWKIIAGAILVVSGVFLIFQV